VRSQRSENFIGCPQRPHGRPKGAECPLGGKRTPGRRPQDSQRLVPRSGMRRSRTK
jgi:hypothetical protein